VTSALSITVNVVIINQFYFTQPDDTEVATGGALGQLTVYSQSKAV